MSDSQVRLTPTEAAAAGYEDPNDRHFVSFSDLAKHEMFKQHTSHLYGGHRSPEDVSGLVITKILHDLGIDTNKRVRFRDCLHRNYAGEVVKCRMWTGYMRRDSAWCKYIEKHTGVVLRKRA